MKIYTKTGDQGETSLGDGRRVSKSHQVIEGVGLLDELNASIGLVLATATLASLDKIDQAILSNTQGLLLYFGAVVAKTPKVVLKSWAAYYDEKTLSALEKRIDQLTSELAPLKNFILPGGHPLAAQIQVARSLCRRVEREIIKSTDSKDITEIVPYLNRFSDYLFTLARYVNSKNGYDDVIWRHK